MFASLWIYCRWCNYLEKTGRTVFTLNEVYETEDGLIHHYLESAEFAPEVFEIVTTHKIELRMYNQLKVTHSLWD